MRSLIKYLFICLFIPSLAYGGPEPLGAPRAEIHGGTISTISQIKWSCNLISSGPYVNWDGGILHMPSGFADGVDNTGSSSGLSIEDFNLHRDTADIKIQATSLATGTVMDVIKTMSSELSDVTNTINTSDNPVSWNSLKDVPAGFADGTDATGEAGGGLSDANWEIHNSTAMIKDQARSNVVASSAAYCARIPATAALEVAVATIAITPKIATSGIKLQGSFLAVKDLGATARDLVYVIRRGITRTAPQVGPFLSARSQAVATTTFMPAALFAIDYPNTTSEVTYTIGAFVTAGISSYTAYNMIAEEVPIP